MSDTILVKCKCSHEYQDKTYGVGIRLANVGISKGASNKYTCTVCGKEHNQAVKKP